MIDAASPIAATALAPQARRVDAAAKEFEAVFIAQMLAPLFSSIDTPAIAGGGKSEEFFKSLLQDSMQSRWPSAAASASPTTSNPPSSTSRAWPTEARLQGALNDDSDD